MVITMPAVIKRLSQRIRLTGPAPGTVRIAVTGEIDLATAPRLRMRLLTAIHEHPPAILDIDLTEVTFLDCSGVGALVAARNAAELVGCQIRISHPQPFVAHVLDIVGLLSPLTAPTTPSQPPPDAASLPTPRTRAASYWAADLVARQAAGARVGGSACAPAA